MNLNLFISKKNQIKISQFESIIIFRKKNLFKNFYTIFEKNKKRIIYKITKL